MNKHPMTKRGADKLRKELQRLKSVDRPRVIQAIAEARAHGDLKENAEYHAAKEAQEHLERKIAELEFKLSRAQVVTDPNRDPLLFLAHLVYAFHPRQPDWCAPAMTALEDAGGRVTPGALTPLLNALTLELAGDESQDREAILVLEAVGLIVTYEQVSSCAGVLVVGRAAAGKLEGVARDPARPLLRDPDRRLSSRAAAGAVDVVRHSRVCVFRVLAHDDVVHAGRIPDLHHVGEPRGQQHVVAISGHCDRVG